MLIFIFIQFIFPFLLPGFIFISFCFCSVWGPNKLTGTQTPVAATTKTGTSPVRKAGGWKTKGMGAKASQLDWLDCRDTSGLESQQRERGGREWKRERFVFPSSLCLSQGLGGHPVLCVWTSSSFNQPPRCRAHRTKLPIFMLEQTAAAAQHLLSWETCRVNKKKRKKKKRQQSQKWEEN